MAKRDLSNTQRKIVNRYYDNKDTIMATKLAELVTELYLSTDNKKTTRLWERVLKALANTDTKPERIDAIVDARDVEKLARLVGELA
jgi:hypothetical protein